MTIFNEYFAIHLYIVHNFRHFFTPNRPNSSLFADFLQPHSHAFLAKSTLPDRPFVQFDKREKIITDFFVLVMICSHLSYIIYMYIFVYRRFPLPGICNTMESQGSKVKVFTLTALILSAVGFALYLLSYSAAGDGSDYFMQGHPLPMLANALAFVSVLWFVSALVLIPKNALPTNDFMRGKLCAAAVFPIIGTLGAGALILAYFGPQELAALLAKEIKIDSTALCTALTAFGAVLSLVYYALRMINAQSTANVSVIMGIGPVAFLTGLCGLTYFEMDHHMNAPTKIALQLAFIVTMVFLTAELRCTIDRAQPRRYLASACIALFANTCAISGAFPVLFNPAEAVHGTRILGFAFLCLCNGIYIAYRLITFCKFCNPSVVPAQMQGKEQEDGCQQQDPMAAQENN